jgi:hypothetical protein
MALLASVVSVILGITLGVSYINIETSSDGLELSLRDVNDFPYANTDETDGTEMSKRVLPKEYTTEIEFDRPVSPDVIVLE